MYLFFCECKYFVLFFLVNIVIQRIKSKINVAKNDQLRIHYYNCTKKGLVAQWTRARGYEPRCRGFESLLARFSTTITTKKIQQSIALYKKNMTTMKGY